MAPHTEFDDLIPTNMRRFTFKDIANLTEATNEFVRVPTAVRITNPVT